MLTFLATSALASAFKGGIGTIASRAATHAKADWAAIPPKARLVIVAIIVAILLFFVHRHYEHKALAAEYRRGMADEAAHIEKQALAIKQKADALNAGIASAIRSKNDEQNRAIAADAGTIRVLGPGKAACHPVLPAAAGGSVTPGSRPDDARPSLPPADGQNMLAAVDWNWLTDRSQEHDQLRAEALAWREWYAKLVAAWPQQPVPSR